MFVRFSPSRGISASASLGFGLRLPQSIEPCMAPQEYSVGNELDINPLLATGSPCLFI